eukprot:CAMPEP_0197414782 /NCGR_PEP_ID=MMETSP1170-20131217/1472_1 /TAXON_ID=54406 /ORGANISM="Sarcinochrysis sp, Strain CCMP770" /LENGTH=46 /DNA_ID= /DNA_START= /DNA_END= /DNA_ORIENTATION=
MPRMTILDDDIFTPVSTCVGLAAPLRDLPVHRRRRGGGSSRCASSR